MAKITQLNKSGSNIKYYSDFIARVKFSTPYKKGDKVRIKANLATLKHRKNKNGIVRYTNGPNLIYVRPTYCNYDVELYPNEIERR